MKKLTRWLVVKCVFFSVVCGLLQVSANAQDFKGRWIAFYDTFYKPIPEPVLASSFWFSVSNKVFKPQGDGPFPAVVLIHTAGGLANEHIKVHAQNFLAKGYVVLIQDSLGPRRISVVKSSTPEVHPPIGVKDAYQAWSFLSKQSYVDKERIYQMGTSWGGFVASSLGSNGIAEASQAKGRFRASVGLYSTCQLGPFDPYRYVFPDTDRPVLLLLAGADQELLHKGQGDCFKELDDMKSKGLPIQFHVYEGIGHAWDKKGESMLGYFYNDDITKDSFNRVIEFFEKHK